MRSSYRFGLCLLPLLPLILSPAAAEDTPPRPGDPRIHVGSMPGWRPDTEVATRSSGGWRSVGPQSLYTVGEDLMVNSGRVVSFALHPTDPKIVYIGSASGGVWKTIDGGLSWMPLTDELPNLNQGCVALAPSRPEEIWVGTGEFSVQSGGAGVFHSTDGGKHWVQRGTAAEVGWNCAALIVDPTRPEIVHFAGNSGYARTNDGGATWRILLDGEVSSLVARPDHPQTLYAVRYVRFLEYAAIFRSVDGGETWQRFSELPDEVNRVTLAIAPSQPEILYALADHDDALALYKSIDGGRHWSGDLLGDRLFAQGGYNQALVVDRHDPAKVWAGGQILFYSPDGGESWELHGRRREFGALYVHADLHAFAWGADGKLWLATDGGVYSNADPTNGLTWEDANHNLATTQSYSLALHPTEERSFLTGTQDNGTLETRNGELSWESIFGGDGFSCAYDPFYPERRFASSQYGFASGARRVVCRATHRGPLRNRRSRADRKTPPGWRTPPYFRARCRSRAPRRFGRSGSRRRPSGGRCRCCRRAL